MESESFEEFQERIDRMIENLPRPTDEDERRDLLALLPAIVETGDLATLLEVRRRLRATRGRQDGPKINRVEQISLRGF